MCAEPISAEPQHEAKKIGAVIYLSSNRPLHLPELFAEFHRAWPSLSLEKTGKEPHRALFRAGKSDFALELHHTPVPPDVSEPVIHSTLHWPMASDALAHHQAHLSVGGSVAGSADGHGVLGLACDLTKAIAALLTVTDSLAVCWLNGPALNASKSFVSTAREMYATGLYPLSLWIGVRWDAQAGALQTSGMAQFDAPEICLAQQPEPSPRMVDYVLLVGQSFLTPHHSIPDGKTIDSPHGKLKVENSAAAGKRILTLKPAR